MGDLRRVERVQGVSGREGGQRLVAQPRDLVRVQGSHLDGVEGTVGGRHGASVVSAPGLPAARAGGTGPVAVAGGAWGQRPVHPAGGRTCWLPWATASSSPARVPTERSGRAAWWSCAA